MTDTEATVVVAVVMVIGLAGTVVPLLPGLALIWAAALVYGLLVGFGAVGVAVMAALTIVATASAVKSVAVPRRMAQGHGVSRWSQLAAFVGAIGGVFLIPLVGVFVGAVVGLFVAELIHHRNWRAAVRASVAVTKGFGLSALIDVGLGMLMIGLWSLWAVAVLT